jgi:hypothetical protein
MRFFMATNPQVTVVEHVDSMMRKDDQSSLTIYYQSNGRRHAICFPRPVLAHLLVGLAGMQRPQSGRPIDIPAILAESIQPFQQDHVSGLGIFLPGGWVLPIAIPQHAIQSMKKTLADLELLAATPRGAA